MARTDDLAKNERSSASTSSPSSSAAAASAAAPKIDYISLLPDHVLLQVVYCLPTQMAIRTTALSSRWHRIWTGYPLRLDGDCIGSLTLGPHGRPDGATKRMHGKNWRSCVITDVLTYHAGPVEQFRLGKMHSGSQEPLRDSWFQFLAQKSVYHIQLEFPFFHRRQDVPVSFLACKTLRSLSLINCRLPDTATAPFGFLHLTDLNLCCMELTEDDYCRIFSGCPGLAQLSLVNNSAVCRICIKYSRLRTLSIGGSWIGELVIEDAY